MRPMVQRGPMLIFFFMMMMMMVMMIAKHRYLNNFTEVVLDIASKTNHFFNILIQQRPWKGELLERKRTLIGLNRDSNLTAACYSVVIRLELFQYSLQDYVQLVNCVATKILQVERNRSAGQYWEDTRQSIRLYTLIQGKLFVLMP